MKDGILLWMYLVIVGVSGAWADPYDGRTMPPADMPDIKAQIEKKRLELDAEEEMSVPRLGFQLALAHHYVRTHVCPNISHYHDYTVYDEDRIADEIIKRYGK